MLPLKALVVTLVVHLIFKLWMKHSVYERDKLSNKEQIESAVSGNIKGWLEPKQRHRMLWRDSAKQHTCSVAWILSGVSSKMSLVSSGQNITMSSVHGLYSSNMVIQIQRLQPSSCPLHYHFYCFSPPPDWLALTLIMPCTLDQSDTQMVVRAFRLSVSEERESKRWVKTYDVSQMSNMDSI